MTFLEFFNLLLVYVLGWSSVVAFAFESAEEGKNWVALMFWATSALIMFSAISLVPRLWAMVEVR